MSGVVQRMNVKQFENILQGEGRSIYQIIDVREKDELQLVSIPGSDIIHLPLSDADNWSEKILKGEILDAAKPTLCLCHHGIRSMNVASFLVSRAAFSEVANIEGGIDAYAKDVNSSVGFY
eukprot:CAMPEP_0174955118 /NCGR_PEP_ID=MMETSP0004_2-20121128/807_1 /TAXON_ID=420556 /ORGANISM="Ochromonas sp., Strain CCMP1393" /LENGTH=120 /DNA_ID=CAMNT_0016203017 /DNA_START=75 /DNA_END=437 /DNA_ORIENTATION=+